MKEGDVNFRYREIGNVWKILVAIDSLAGIAVVIFYIFNLSIAGNVFTEIGYFFLLMALLLPPLFLYVPASKEATRRKVPWYDIVTVLLSFGISFYLFLVSYDIFTKGWEISAPFHIFVLCLIEIIIVFEAVRRSVGLSLALICLFFLLFPLFASHIPPPFSGVDFSFKRIITFQVLGSEGFLGIPMRVVGTLLIGFMVFAVALIATGGGSFFLNIALALLGHVRGGPAKVCIISSAFFGSISGSVTSNVLTTGSITIPTMKRSGYPAHYAGALEACASTGGVLMPPVMGAAAFLIAQFLSIPYYQVALAAAIPSLLYYWSLFVQADAYSAKKGFKGLPKENMPSLLLTLKQGWFYIISFIVLVWLLVVIGREGQAPFYATAVLIILSSIRKETRFDLHKAISFLEDNARTLAELIAIMLGVGIIIGALSGTGVAHGFSEAVIEIAGDSVPMLLLLGALTAFILGMGMSVTAVYIFLAILLAPALVAAGLYPLGVHLFILYWAMISFISPPVAVGAFVAAGIAGANPMKVAVYACRLGLVIFFIPFFFVIEPALLLHGSVFDIILSVVTALIGVLFLASGVEGYLLKVGILNWWSRIIFIIAGLLMIYPHLYVTIPGLIIAAILSSILLVRKRSQPVKAPIAGG